MNLPKKEKYIAESDFFSDLNASQHVSLAEIALYKNLDKGEFLFHEAQEGLGLFLLVEGSIQVFKSTEDGREVVIKMLKPGEVFGEVVLFESRGYPANASALTKSNILLFPRHQIDCLLENREFRNAFIGMLFKKLRYLTERLLDLTSHDVEERFFLFLESHYGKRKEYSIDMTKKDIAAGIAASPETLSRLIAKLEKEKKIRWQKKTITILS
ncbi:MAG: Crp/Fnr family transcriptional regulator [Spirochaetales bacterium]|nr:Crp/Fnr family transcriptional regulator [Spirochaetales bacterium]